MPDGPSLAEAIREATVAFDAGNHAWGRYLLYVLRPYRGNPPAPSPDTLRAALQEAALSVPQSTDLGEIGTFALALQAAQREAIAFLAALPEPLRTGDVLTVPDAFAQALAWLAEGLRESDEQ